MINNQFWSSEQLVHDVLLACGNSSPTPIQCEFVYELLTYAVTNTTFENVRKLSDRERDCLFWIAHGKTIEEMASLMKIKTCTVQTYRQRIRHKLNCDTLAQAVFCTMCYQPKTYFYNIH